MQPAQPEHTSDDRRDLAPAGQLVASWAPGQVGLDGRVYAVSPALAQTVASGEDVGCGAGTAPLSGASREPSLGSSTRFAGQLSLPGFEWQLLRASGPLFDTRTHDDDGVLIVDPALGAYAGEHTRLGKCHRCKRNKDQIKIVRENNQWHVENLVVCGTWQCPYCGARNCYEAASVLSTAVDTWRQREHHDVWLFSPTIRHTSEETIAVVTDRLFDSWRYFAMSDDWKYWLEAQSIEAVVRCLDETISVANYHPHFHCLLFTSDNPWLLDPKERSSSKKVRGNILRSNVEDLLPAWSAACRRAGMPWPSNGNAPAGWDEHALTLKNGDKAAGYVVKWGLGEEASRGDKKDKSHLALLAEYAAGNVAAGARYREWADATRGRHFVTGLKRVRELVGVTDEMIKEHQKQRREKIEEEKRESGEYIPPPRPRVEFAIAPWLEKAALSLGWPELFAIVEFAEDWRNDPRAAVDAALYKRARERESRVRGPP